MENNENIGPRLAAEAIRCWNRSARFREERLRNKRFTYGDQWGDRVEENGVMVREEDIIRNQGNIPLKNNLIRRLVRNVLGVFRNQWQLPRCRARDPQEEHEAQTMEQLLHYNMETNRIEEVYARTMEEFLISGLAVHKKWYGRKGGLTDCWTDFVEPERFFVDTASRDFRTWDVRLIGEFHDLIPGNIPLLFGDSCDNPDLLRRLAERTSSPDGEFGFGDAGVSGGWAQGECRVIEVWHREKELLFHCHDPLDGCSFRGKDAEFGREVADENRRRRSAGLPPIRVRRIVTDEWHYHFLTPGGEILAHGKSPYLHGSHPYIFKAYPFIDGEIHSFVGDVIDQQKLTNRLISMYDWILRASAKGVLLFPEGSLPDGGSMEEVCDEWSRFNGVLVYRPRPGNPLPQQVSSKATDIGITELLDIQMKMMEDISGVNGALQGKLANSSMSGTLYDQQTRNSMTALTDLLRSFDDFIREATLADVANIRRFYSPRRIARVCGRATPGWNARFSGAGTPDFRITTR